MALGRHAQVGSVGRWRPVLWTAILALLLLPLLAMRFTSEVAWGAEDFAAAGLLLGTLGLGLEAIVRLTRRRTYRIAASAALAGAVALIWADAAVGVF